MTKSEVINFIETNFKFLKGDFKRWNNAVNRLESLSLDIGPFYSYFETLQGEANINFLIRSNWADIPKMQEKIKINALKHYKHLEELQ